MRVPIVILLCMMAIAAIAQEQPSLRPEESTLEILSDTMGEKPAAGEHIRNNEIDLAQVLRILGEDNPSLPEAPGKIDEKMLDNFATYATMRLGQGDREWNTSNPKWNVVFSRVRADLGRDAPAAAAAAKAALLNLGQSYELDVASELRQSDIDAILAYFDSPQGSRYEVFLRHIDSLWNPEASSSKLKTLLLPTTTVLPKKKKQYLEMIQMSRLYQATMAAVKIDSAAHRDISGYDAIGFFEGAAINENQEELRLLHREYAADLSAFEAFQGTKASQHLFRAMAIANARLTKRATSTQDALNVVTRYHESEWKAAYQAETAK